MYLVTVSTEKLMAFVAMETVHVLMSIVAINSTSVFVHSLSLLEHALLESISLVLSTMII